MHVLLGYNVSVAEELAVKWYEMSTLGLPSSALASFFGPLNVVGTAFKSGNTHDLQQMSTVYLPHVLSCIKPLSGHKHTPEFFMNIYFEKEFETDINELRQRMRIIPLD